MVALSASITAHIASSGLTVNDLRARVAEGSELAACGVSDNAEAYVIPYYDIEGKAVPFYRIRMLDHNPKYKQPKNAIPHVYYPPSFPAVMAKNKRYVIVTEGEKKAAAACKQGFPTVGLGGVDSWRTRILILPGDTMLTAAYGKTKQLVAKLPSTASQLVDDYTLATGMPELQDLIMSKTLSVIIIFDSDTNDAEASIKPEVQRAAAALGYDLRHKGISPQHIRQLVLPNGEDETTKVGLDDFLNSHSAKELSELIEENLLQRSTFPRHPNPRAFVNTRLQKKLSRRENQTVALAILTELDAQGFRLRSKSTSMPYYFDEDTHSLMPAPLMQKHGEPMHESAFGNYLYRRFGLSAADTRIITWLATQFTGEDPIEVAEPKRVLALPQHRPDSIAFQTSDGGFFLVTPDADKELGALLFYISPWLNRWRNTQVPVELMIGEAGSGKSSIYSLRQTILTGRPLLRNAPSDLRDWHASVTNTGGIHVTDNVQFTNKDLRQRISDEICRITTEPSPHVEMRKLYSTVGQLQIPVAVSFAITAIQQPFYNADILQRAAVFETDAIRDPHDGDWVNHQLEKYGGREEWVAHHLVFLHRFLKAVAKEGAWDTEYQSTHRLIHYEQSLQVAADIFGMDTDCIPEALSLREI